MFGGDIDGYNSYAQRGNLPTIEDVCEGGMALMPAIGRSRICVRGAALSICPWTARQLSTWPRAQGLYLSAGWCYGGLQGHARFRLVLRPSDRTQ